MPEVLARAPVAHHVVRARHSWLARLVMARVRQTGESSLINSVISNRLVLRDSGFGFWVSVFGFRVSIFGFRGYVPPSLKLRARVGPLILRGEYHPESPGGLSSNHKTRWGQHLSDTCMYLSISFKKSTSPQNRQLIVYCY